MARLTVSLLGSLEIKLDDQPVTHLLTGKARALLAYLAIEAARPHRRETLGGLLWPDYEERSARANLRNALSSLRTAIGDRRANLGDQIGEPFLLVARETIQFNAESDCWIDVATFNALIEANRTDPAAVSALESAAALYRGPFLEGFAGGDSPAFENWALIMREQLEQQALQALQSLTAHHEREGEYARAREYTRRQIALAPWQEQAHQSLMRLLALSGQRGAALAQYEACCHALREELDVEPGEQTRRLYERIRDGELAPPSPPLSLPLGGKDEGVIPASREAERAETGKGKLSGERRVVTAMFADIQGSTALAGQIDTEDWVEIMRHTLQVLSAEIHRYGGQVDRYEGDGLVAFFGLSAAHEDDAERAVLAALAMQEAVKHYAEELAEREGAPVELLMRVGLATGEVIATHVGEAFQHGEATAMGQTIALAARLEPAAEPGTVLVGENTYRLVEHAFEWQAIGGIAAKGYSEPVAAYRPLKHKATASKERGIEGLESPLVGRDQEFHALEEAIEHLQAGIGGIVTVVGEAGIGKSRLVTEVRKWANPKSENLQWVEGRCLSYATNTVYQVWLDIVRELLGVEPDAPPAAVQEALEQRVQTLCPDCYEDVYPYLARMLSLSLGERTEAAQRSLGAEGIKLSTFRAVETLVERAAQQCPLVLVCEDLHWTDPTSLELLERLLPLVDLIPLLLLCILRPERAHSCWGIVETATRDYPHRHTDLRLKPLCAAESETLVSNLLHIEDLPGQLRRRILEHAEGNPFFVEEILRGLIDNGIIAHDGAADPSTGLRASTPERRSEAETAKRSPDTPDTVVSGQCEARGDPPGTRGSGAGRTGRWYATRDVSDIPIPDTLHGALSARIDRLEPKTRHILQLASVIGRIFTYPVLSAIATDFPLSSERSGDPARLSAGQGDPLASPRPHSGQEASHGPGVRGDNLDSHLLAHLVTLERAQLIRARASLPEREYIFKHHLTQEAAYNSLLKRERRAYHYQVAEALERLYPERIEEWVELLAHHWEQAGQTEKAIYYLHQAGDKAVQQSAYQEGRAHLTRALDLLLTQPDTPERAERELALQLSLAMAWMGGAPYEVLFVEWTRALSRARELCLQTGKTSQFSRILGMFTIAHYVGSEHSRARELGEEALDLAQQAKDPLLIALGHWHLGFILFALGEYTAAHTHLKQTIASYEPQHHHALVALHGADAGPGALAYDALCLWCLGYPEQASQRSQEALARARELDHPFTLADALCYGGCLLNEISRDAQVLRDHAEALTRLAKETLPAFSAMGSRFRGTALVMLGRVQEGMAQLRESITIFQSIDIRLYVPGALGFLSETQARAGQPQEGLTTLGEAFELMEKTGERHWEAELHRVRGELMMMQGDEAEAEVSLHKAIEVARRQQARSWELRATTSLARLWQGQGRADEAQEMLAEIYGWFTEGFDSADLVEAKTLLEELS